MFQPTAFQAVSFQLVRSDRLLRVRRARCTRQWPRHKRAVDEKGGPALVRKLRGSGPSIAAVEGRTGQLPDPEVRLQYLERSSHGNHEMLAYRVCDLMGRPFAECLCQFGMTGRRI